MAPESDVLARIPLFERLSDGERARIAALTRRERFRQGTAIFFEGDRSDALYVLLQGAVKIYKTSEAGREKILRTLGPGEIVGELGLIDGAPRSASVATVEDSELLAIGQLEFRRLALESPEMMWKVLEALTARLRRQSDEVLDLAFREAPYRLIRAIVELCGTRGQATGVRVEVAARVHDLADMIGVGPERVVRILDRLAERGLVEPGDDRLAVPDLPALRRSLEYAEEWSRT